MIFFFFFSRFFFKFFWIFKDYCIFGNFLDCFFGNFFFGFFFKFLGFCKATKDINKINGVTIKHQKLPQIS